MRGKVSGGTLKEDVSVAEFDDIPLSRQVWSARTTVRQPIHQIPQTATEILLRPVNHARSDTLQMEFPTKLINRNRPDLILPHNRKEIAMDRLLQPIYSGIIEGEMSHERLT